MLSENRAIVMQNQNQNHKQHHLTGDELEVKKREQLANKRSEMTRELQSTIGSFNPVLSWDNPNPEATKQPNILLWLQDLIFYRFLGFHIEYVAHVILLYGIRVYSHVLY